jgi:hypothetical protein
VVIVITFAACAVMPAIIMMMANRIFIELSFIIIKVFVFVINSIVEGFMVFFDCYRPVGEGGYLDPPSL